MYTRPRLDINLNRILENYQTFCNANPNPTTKMAAVVKDNAYGLGDKEVAAILYTKGNCRTFFVAHGFEGERVRSVAPDADIYVLQGPGEEDLECFKNSNLIPVIACPAQWAFWKKHRPNNTKPAIQIETGLNRLGFRESDLLALNQNERDEFNLVLSHLACADEPSHPMNKKQTIEFNRLKKLFPVAKFSLAASDGFILGDQFRFDVVRLGAVLYGLNPVPDTDLISKNVIRVTAPVLQIATVKAGDSIGYGADYIAPKDMKIAIVSIGYGDGVFRRFFPKGKLWFIKDDKRFSAPLAGRVSMDNLICDVSTIPDEVLHQCQFVTLLDDAYDADTVGVNSGTIGYEVLNAFGHGIRFVRTYV